MLIYFSNLLILIIYNTNFRYLLILIIYIKNCKYFLMVYIKYNDKYIEITELINVLIIVVMIR